MLLVAPRWSTRARTLALQQAGLRLALRREGGLLQRRWLAVAGHRAGSEPVGYAGERLGVFGRRVSREGLFLGTVAAPSPQTTVEELVARISPALTGLPSRSNSISSQLVLLLTPRYAQHALSPGLPTSVMQRFGPNPTSSKPLDAITAVVDRLPIPGGPAGGGEGLAYAFVTNPATLPSSTQTPLKLDAQKPGSLTFELPAAHIMARHEHDFSRTNYSTTVQIPLAHTIFSNGIPSTLVHTSYQYDPLNGQLRKSASQHLETQTVRIPRGKNPSKSLYSVNLIPLTPVREVSSWMGNIIRTLSPTRLWEARGSEEASLDDFTKTPLPASQELEAAVSNWFSERNIPPQPVQVWALILPDKGLHGPYGMARTMEHRSILSFDPESRGSKGRFFIGQISQCITAFLRDGARLHRVLSGGGGWGKKAGLLSLDPDTKYSTRDLRDEKGWQFDFEAPDTDSAMQQQQKEALGDVVERGESVMFFLASRVGERKPMRDWTARIGRERDLVFGTIPSSIDDVTPSEAGEGLGEKPERQDPKHFAHLFGALSEGGMAIEMLDGDQPVTQTKADVPFSSLMVYATRLSSKTRALLTRKPGVHGVGYRKLDRNEDS